MHFYNRLFQHHKLYEFLFHNERKEEIVGVEVSSLFYGFNNPRWKFKQLDFENMHTLIVLKQWCSSKEKKGGNQVPSKLELATIWILRKSKRTFFTVFYFELEWISKNNVTWYKKSINNLNIISLLCNFICEIH